MNETFELPTPNIPLLRKAVEWAEAEAARPKGECEWYQGVWRRVTACRTSYCIAGYVAAVTGAEWSPTDSFDSFLIATPDDPPLQVDSDGEVEVADRAARLLGLTDIESDQLFEGGNTIERVRLVAERIAARAGERL